MHRVTATPGILISAWPGEESTVVFVPETSRTHLVSRLAGDVLVAADGRAVSQADLQRVCTRYIHGTEEPFNEADETDANLTSEVLKGLIDVGLLRSVE